jgi:hypothetical protein
MPAEAGIQTDVNLNNFTALDIPACAGMTAFFPIATQSPKREGDFRGSGRAFGYSQRYSPQLKARKENISLSRWRERARVRVAG